MVRVYKKVKHGAAVVKIVYGLRLCFSKKNAPADDFTGLTLQECFDMGYELAQVHSLLRRACGFQMVVFEANLERIRKACRGENREVRVIRRGQTPESRFFPENKLQVQIAPAASPTD